MHDFTPWSGLAGGALMGLAASLLLLANGHVAGISGILRGLLVRRGGVAWRGLFVAGLVLAGLAAQWLSPERLGVPPRSLGLIALAGLLVGVGTCVGSGCPSGHGVCGLSRQSPRSLAATLTFIASGIVVVAIIRMLGGES